KTYDATATTAPAGLRLLARREVVVAAELVLLDPGQRSYPARVRHGEVAQAVDGVVVLLDDLAGLRRHASLRVLLVPVLEHLAAHPRAVLDQHPHVRETVAAEPEPRVLRLDAGGEVVGPPRKPARAHADAVLEHRVPVLVLDTLAAAHVRHAALVAVDQRRLVRYAVLRLQAEFPAEHLGVALLQVELVVDDDVVPHPRGRDREEGYVAHLPAGVDADVAGPVVGRLPPATFRERVDDAAELGIHREPGEHRLAVPAHTALV